MSRRAFTLVIIPALLVTLGSTIVGLAQSVNPPAGPQINAVPFEYDPQHLEVVAAEWKGGIGCQEIFDPVCMTSNDAHDNFVAGLLLVKSGSLVQNASAGVSLTGVKGITLTELGFDIRKKLSVSDSNGSHCGAGAPRFNITTSDGVLHFIGCNSPPADVQTVGLDWIRLRWTFVDGAHLAFPTSIGPGSTVSSISIVFDEGQDAGPDNFGLAVLDNIDVNGQLIGTGPRGPAK